MPIHDWTRVEEGIFRHFYLEWIGDISRVLNRGLLPLEHYALAEKIFGGPGLDDLHGHRAEPDLYAAITWAVVIRHASDHRVIAILEIVSPGNKNSRHGLRAFVAKAVEILRAGVHLLIVDLFPPGPRDPQGIHKAVWDEFIDEEFTLPAGKPLTLAAYIGGFTPEAFAEFTAVGGTLPDMPLFLAPDAYIPVPLEATYQSAWEAVPSFWRDVLTAPPGP